MTAIDTLLDHVLATRHEDLPPEVVAAAKAFILDSVGVGLSGARHPRTAQVLRAARQWGEARQARVWCSGEYLPAASAAMLNAYQVHNQEYDCVHEAAVVHPMATVLPALMAYAEREGGISGQQLVLALTLGVDVATLIGMAQGAPMRFFRPAMCGALGATAALAKLAGCDRATLHNALGLVYSQLSGTMQAHLEGSPALALQVGLNARAALTALDLAQQGFEGPKDILDGPFGYFALFDGQADWGRASTQLGRQFQVAQLSHKPFPTGRAAHGALDGLLTLRHEHGFGAADVAAIELAAPPLVLRLVGRPAHAGMDANYAKLCLPYLVALALRDGDVGLDAFAPAHLQDSSWLALAAKVSWRANEVADANALAPQSLAITLADGRCLRIDLPHVLGHPGRKFDAVRQLAKFEACCRSADPRFDAQRIAALAAALHDIEQLADVRELIDLMVVPS